MNGVHDMGGMGGFGQGEIEAGEPVFHEKWEGRVMALVRAMGASGAFNIDTSRFYREALPPHVYLSSSYYKKWLLGLTDNLVAKGFISRREAETGHASEPAKPLKRGRLTLDQVSRVFTRGSFRRDAQAPAKFKIGDRVRCRNINPVTHTRLPRYVRGHVGVVELNHGPQVYPDSSATDRGDDPPWVYTVGFRSGGLW